MRKAAGFTLIELLVSLLIVGLVLGFAVVNYQGGDNQILNRQAKRLYLVLESAIDHALFQQQTLVLAMDENRYQVLSFSKANGDWQSIEHRLFSLHKLSEKIILTIKPSSASQSSSTNSDENKLPDFAVNNFLQPAVIISPGGQTKPFTVTLKLKHSNYSQTITYSVLNGLQMNNE